MIFKTGKYHICIKKERMIYISENIDVSPFIKSFEEFKSIGVDPNGDVLVMMQYNGEFIFVRVGGYDKNYKPCIEATHLICSTPFKEEYNMEEKQKYRVVLEIEGEKIEIASGMCLNVALALIKGYVVDQEKDNSTPTIMIVPMQFA